MDAQTYSSVSPEIEPALGPDEIAGKQLDDVPQPSNKTPEEFYAEITRRPDIRAILEELSRG
ncbi:MAG TPA: hypothetical protein VFL82_07465 [Thermomicrobiales bacterium]|jgi:hypothetical protein|nr:hypothetical protein [Thermomicrobiales bacterium]